MRGIVTLAAALALPDGVHGGAAFPYRDQVVAAAFAVVLGTLVLQGMTLRPLMRLLDLGDDGAVGVEVARARRATAEAAMLVLADDGSAAGTALRIEYQARLTRAAGTGLPGDAAADTAAGLLGLLRAAIAAERRALFELRASQVIGDDAFHVLEEELDWAEVSARRRDAGA